MKLETRRLILRDWEPADISDLVEGLNNSTVSKWLAFVPYPYTEHDAKKWVDFCISISQKSGARESYEFAIVLKENNKVIGGTSVTRISQVHETASGGIWINSDYQRQGYGNEAFGERIRFAFEDLNLRRLENGFFPDNTASLIMQEKFGYKCEGEKRDAYRCMADGLLKNECITGLLKSEWRRQV